MAPTGRSCDSVAPPCPAEPADGPGEQHRMQPRVSVHRANDRRRAGAASAKRPA
jgi:hypothetical protein